jgi:hypothetical protein
MNTDRLISDPRLRLDDTPSAGDFAKESLHFLNI